MTQKDKVELLSICASNFLTASNIMSNLMYSDSHPSLKQMDLDKALVLARAALEAFDDKDDFFKED